MAIGMWDIHKPGNRFISGLTELEYHARKISIFRHRI
jgi:hypothetical protein